MVEYVHLTDMDLRRHVEDQGGYFMAEGFFVLERVVGHRLTIRSLLIDERRMARTVDLLLGLPEDQRPTVFTASADVLGPIVGYRMHRGVLACVQRPEPASLTDIIATGGDLLVLEGLVDPTNVGLAFRSAAAMGFTGAVVSPDCADPLYRRAVRTSMGASLDLPWTRSTTWSHDLDVLADHGMWTVGLSPDPAGDDLDQVVRRVRAAGGRVAAVFGSEGPGLRRQTLQQAACVARITMERGIDSLNVAASVAVVGYVLRHVPLRPTGRGTVADMKRNRS